MTTEEKMKAADRMTAEGVLTLAEEAIQYAIAGKRGY